MKHHLLLVFVCLITWQIQGKAKEFHSDIYPNISLDTIEQFDINEEIDIAIEHADASLRKLAAEVSSDDVESLEQSDASKPGTPVDGAFSLWRKEKCTKSCGGGVMTEQRLCDNPFPAFGGKSCAGCVSRVKTCNPQHCPIPGGWSKWTETKCPCGVKTKTKTRKCSNPYPAYNGKTCVGSKTEKVPCKENPCPVDGGWTPWAKTPCSKSCGGGDTTKTRTCTKPAAQYGGKPCKGDESSSKSCNTKPCPVDGKWSKWSPYEKCSKSCEGGKKIKRRTCSSPPPKYLGKNCAGPNKDSADCNQHPCPKHACLKPMDFVIVIDSSHKTTKTFKEEVKVVEKLVDTIYKKFADSRISVHRFDKEAHTVTKFTKVGLYINIVKKIKDLKKFNPKNVKVRRTDLGLQSALKEFKDNGRKKVFKVVVLITNGPTKASPAALKEVETKLKKAKITVTVVGVDLQKLPKKTKTKTIKEIKKIASSKEHVFIRTITELLNKKSKKLPIDKSFCAEDGMWTPWTVTKCSKTCGGGKKTRSRTCTDPAPKSGGKDCPGNKKESLPCNKKKCPVNGHWTPWQTTKCSKTCGVGSITRSRKCIGRKYGGKACDGKYNEVLECSKKPCPIDGNWSPWSSTTCSRTCGGGKIIKTRKCSNPHPKYKGKECKGLTQKIDTCNVVKCPVDGNWTPWKKGSCSKSCGGGTYKKTRSCSNPPPSNGGKVCVGEAMEQLTCNTKPCKVPGGWTPWEDGICSKTCGGGVKIRSRTCTKPSPAFGGAYCSKLLAGAKKTLSCSTNPCPVDGNWSPWTEGPCSKTCGGGLKKKSRSCNKPRPKYNGKECAGKVQDDVACNGKPCPVDGGWTPFGKKTPCSKSCGGGTTTRTRKCTKPAPANGGKDCLGDKTDTKKCNTHKCPVDGNWSPWSKTPCSKTCGKGTYVKVRKCNNPPPANKGRNCPGAKKSTKKECNKKPCPVPGGWTPWSKTPCSKTCGGGKKQLVRTCTKPKPANGGKKCGGVGKKEENCNTKPCPVDGKWSPWSDAKCTKTCGGGTITRTRSCNNPVQAHGGKACPGSPILKKKCNAQPCPAYICKDPLDLVIVLDHSGGLSVAHWKKEILLAEKIVKAAFTEHPKVNVALVRFAAKVTVDVTLKGSAGSYSKVIRKLKDLSKKKPAKKRSKATQATIGLNKALALLKKEKRAKATKIIAILTDGIPSSPKKDQLGKVIGYTNTPIGTLTAFKAKVLAMKANVLAVGFGTNLLNSATKKKLLAALQAIATDEFMAFGRTYAELFNKAKLSEITDSLCPINGEFTEWKEKEVCSKTCGTGKKKLERTCSDPKPQYNGKKCVGKTSKIVKCNPTPCPVDGKWSPWVKTKCSVSCNGGKLTRTRTCSKPPPKNKGKVCPGVDKEVIDCNTQKCPIDGNWTPWKSGSCSKTCGGGKEVLTRKCSNPYPQFKGKKCPGSATKTIKCNEKNCPVDGGWTPWTPVTKCSKSCGKGSKIVERTCTKPSPKYNGKTCKGGNKKDVSCNEIPCPVDGKWTPWADTKCSKSCGGGERKRTRSCTDPKPANGGRACEGSKTETIECNTKLCPTPGNWSPWEKGDCSKSCGGGVRSITRKCNNPPPSNGGKYCPGQESQEAICNAKPCPVDGNWTPWSHGKCSRTCGGGLKKYTRTCSSPRPKNEGKECAGLAFKNVECNTAKCPIPGKWSPWNKWSSCTKSCAGGVRTRKRNCDNPEPKFNGKECEGEVSETAKCNVKHCPACHPEGCKGCKCHGVQFKKGQTFLSHDCQAKCTCSKDNKVRCYPLCKQPWQVKKASCATGTSEKYTPYAVGSPLGSKSKKCYCYKSKCEKSCPKGILCHDKKKSSVCVKWAKKGWCTDPKQKALTSKLCKFSCSQHQCATSGSLSKVANVSKASKVSKVKYLGGF